MPPLYRAVTLSLDQLDEDLAHRFHPGNPGVAHIRHLAVGKHGDVSIKKSDSRYLAALVIEIPKDRLVTFRVNMGNNLSSGLAHVVRLRQRRLINYQLQGHDHNDIVDYLPDVDELRNVTALSLVLRASGDVIRAAQVLRNAHAVRSLALVVAMDDSENTPFFVVECYAWMQILLSELPASQGRVELRLTHLHLEGFHLGQCGPLVANIVAPQHLRMLSMVKCWDTNSFLKSLLQAGVAPCSLVDDQSRHESDEPGIMGDFLASYRGLERLKLTTTRESNLYADCDWTVLKQHAPTLHTLFVDDFDDGPDPFESAVYDRKLTTLQCSLANGTVLRELALHVPTPALRSGSFVGLVCFLKLLANLRTLRLFMYPKQLSDPQPCRDAPDGCSHEYALQRESASKFVQDLASALFKDLMNPCPMLKCLVIDARYPSQVLGDPCLQSGFLRVLQTDIYGHTSAAAVPCEIMNIRLHEPYSDILEDEVSFDGLM
ncbi:hypothetical protein LTS10_003231 [Elasticomyces elasticus]|nr:hypothetical protein LTS10_003231 [Elasticomyces elasticus]